MGCALFELLLLDALIEHRANSFFGHLSLGNPQAKQLQDGAKVLAIFKKKASQADEISAVHRNHSVSPVTDKLHFSRPFLNFELGGI